MNIFSLDVEQIEKINTWAEEQDRIVLERQRRTMTPEEFDHLTMNGQYPYYGAIGGGLTYSFTPTGLGVVVKITHNATNAVLDASDYDNW